MKRWKMPCRDLAGALILGALLTACAAAPAPQPAPAAVREAPPPLASRESLHTTLWVQTAAEYEAAALQAYAAARAALDAALADPAWTAAVEQQGEEVAALPPAVILDVDETVLDNSPYQAWLLRSGEVYTPDSWNRWVEARAAAPVPGALDFTRHAASLGVTVFYVTNRRAPLLAATRDNLARHGFPLAEGHEVLMLRDGRPGWGSDKASRRRAVAEDFRVVQLLGDNLGDFLSGIDTTVAERAELVERYRGWWGERWILLPNPMYGSWLSALAGGGEDLSAEELLRRQYEALEVWE